MNKNTLFDLISLHCGHFEPIPKKIIMNYLLGLPSKPSKKPKNKKGRFSHENQFKP
jgi:hypothetical protein